MEVWKCSSHVHKYQKQWRSDNLAIKERYLIKQSYRLHRITWSLPARMTAPDQALVTQLRCAGEGKELSAETATSNDGTSLTCSAWLNLSPPPPHSQSIGSPQTDASWLAGTLPLPSPPRSCSSRHFFLFNNQPWKGVGRKTSKYSHIHDSTRHECTAKLSQTALRGGAQTDEGFNSWPLESAEQEPSGAKLALLFYHQQTRLSTERLKISA